MVICGGGVSLFEVCAMGLPALSIANEDQEKKTIDFFEQHNATINLCSVHEIVPEALGNKLSNALSNFILINELGKNGMRLVKLEGTHLAYKLIREHCSL